MPPSPLLSVVIPTYDRPQLLKRAILSALSAAPERSIEVIVVPNGVESTWKPVATRFDKNPLIRWEAIPEANACKARNHGLFHAKGKYVRFLDDDDYLLEGASLQIEAMEADDCEVCSGTVINVNSDGSLISTLPVPMSDDFVIATTLATSLPLPVGNVFRRSSILPFRWNEEVSRTQDNVWMYTLAGGKEWAWTRIAHVVGAWYQHNAARLSTTDIAKDCYPAAIPALERLWRELQASGRLTEERAAAIAKELWRHVHVRFPYQPAYWTRIAKLARSIDPQSKPDSPIFQAPILRTVPPDLIEWALYPARAIRNIYRRLARSRRPSSYIRNI